MTEKGFRLYIGVLLAIAAILIACVYVQVKRENDLRTKLSPLQYAEHEIAENDDAGAIQDLGDIAESSADYAQAQADLAAAKQRVRLRQPPYPKLAEHACREAMETEEEFPSTIEVGLIRGVKHSLDTNARQILVTINYSAKNSSGAELPYQFNCITDYSGQILGAVKRGL